MSNSAQFSIPESMNKIKSLMDETPVVIYRELYDLRGVSNHVKSEIALACLKDKSNYIKDGVDPCTRNAKLMKAYDSLQKLKDRQCELNIS